MERQGSRADRKAITAIAPAAPLSRLPLQPLSFGWEGVVRGPAAISPPNTNTAGQVTPLSCQSQSAEEWMSQESAVTRRAAVATWFSGRRARNRAKRPQIIAPTKNPA